MIQITDCHPSPAVRGDDVWRIDSKLPLSIAAVVLASRTGSQPPYGTTEHATEGGDVGVVEWAKAAGGRVVSVASAVGGAFYAYATVGQTSHFKI